MNRDIIQQLSKYTDGKTLIRLLAISKSLYYNEDLWRAIFLQKFYHLRYLKDYKSWRILLIETIKIITQLKEEYGFDYYPSIDLLCSNALLYMGNPKRQYKIFKKLTNKKDMDKLLVIASNKGEFSLVIFALDNGANIHAKDDESLRRASLNGHLEIVQYLIQHGANIHVHSDAALRYASLNGHLEVVKYLLKHDADIHAN